MILHIATDQKFRGFAPQLVGRRRRHGSAVDRIEIAAGGQHVRTAARRRPGWTGGHKTTGKTGENAGHLGRATSFDGRFQPRLDLIEHQPRRHPAFRAGKRAGNQPAGKDLDALDRIAIGAPHVAGLAGEQVGARTDPFDRHVAIQRIECETAIIGSHGQPGIRRDRPLQALVAPLAKTARHAGERHGQVGEHPPRRRYAENVQAVADLHFLEVAEIGVELFQRLLLRLALLDAGIAVEADIGDEIEDLLAQQLQAARIDAGGFVILVDQRFQILERPIALRPRQRRRQVADDDGGRPALGLAALAGIVDDKRIEMRRRAEDHFRVAAFRQGKRLARQPFHIAMLAHVDDGVGAVHLAQIGIKGEITVRRHQIRGMITFLRIDLITTRRLDTDHDVAEAGERQGKRPFVEERIGLRRAPATCHLILNLNRKRREEGVVLTQ